MALSSVIKCSPSKWQKNQQKDANHLKNNMDYFFRCQKSTFNLEKNQCKWVSGIPDLENRVKKASYAIKPS